MDNATESIVEDNHVINDNHLTTIVADTTTKVIDMTTIVKDIIPMVISSTVHPEEHEQLTQLGGGELKVLDIVVIVLYFVGILGVGYWSSKKSKGDSVSGYFLASRSMHWVPVGASLFASNIGSGHFIGLAGSGASSGIAISGFELNALFVLLILGWIFVPVYTAAGVYTMPEYLKKRFGGERIRIYLSVLALLLYIFTKISADLYAGAIFIKQSLDLNLYVSVGILLAIAALFTIGGGLTAVMWTDFVQTILMLVGACILTIISLIKVGGYRELMDNFAVRAEPTNNSYAAIDVNNKSCSRMTEYYKNLLRPVNDPDLPWTGMIFGLTVSAVWYWCSDQVIVQRALSAKNVSHAKGGCLLAAVLKLSPLYLLVLPGMAARILWPNEIGCSNPVLCKEICGSESGCTNIAYPLLVLRVMPQGLTGLMLSVMMAALMSSLTSIFNSASTIFTIDIWKRIRKDADDIEQVIVGRIFVLVLVIVSIVWIPIIEASQGSQLFHYIQSVTSYLAPPVCAVYVLALFWSRINEKGAFWGLMSGLVIGMIRFVFEFAYKVPTCASHEPDPRPSIISSVHYLHFGIILFLIVCCITIGISLATDPIDIIYLYRLTFKTRFSERIRIDIDSDESSSVQNNNRDDTGIYNTAFTGSTNIINMMTINSEIRQNPQLQYNQPNDKPKLRWFYTLCCMSKQNNNYAVNDGEVKHNSRMSKEEEAQEAADSAKEQPFAQSLCDGIAIIIVAFGAFFWGLYA